MGPRYQNDCRRITIDLRTGSMGLQTDSSCRDWSSRGGASEFLRTEGRSFFGPLHEPPKRLIFRTQFMGCLNGRS